MMVGLASAGVTWFEKCPTLGVDLIPQNNIDLDRYFGRWYEAQRDTTTTFEYDARCVTATYSDIDKANGLIKVENRQWNWWFFFSYNDIKGEAKCSAEGYCAVNFPKYDTSQEVNYHIMSTDYLTHSIVYNCKEQWFGLYKTEVLWILARKPNVDQAYLNSKRAIVTEKIPWYNHERDGIVTDHSDCEYE